MARDNESTKSNPQWNPLTEDWLMRLAPVGSYFARNRSIFRPSEASVAGLELVPSTQRFWALSIFTSPKPTVPAMRPKKVVVGPESTPVPMLYFQSAPA